MATTHNTFLEIAKESVEKDGEHWVRNAISRAYYCMFHAAQRLTDGTAPTQDAQGQPLRGGTHQRFSDYLCDGQAAKDYGLDAIELKKIGLRLKTAHHKRVVSDYHLERKVNKIDARMTILDAENMSNEIDCMLASKENVG